jgi:hypothetical protein
MGVPGIEETNSSIEKAERKKKKVSRKEIRKKLCLINFKLTTLVPFLLAHSLPIIPCLTY